MKYKFRIYIYYGLNINSAEKFNFLKFPSVISIIRTNLRVLNMIKTDNKL